MTEDELRQMRKEYRDWMESVGYSYEYIMNDPFYRIMTTVLEGRKLGG